MDNQGGFRMTMVEASAYPTVDVYVATSPDGMAWLVSPLPIVHEEGASNWDPTLVQHPNGNYELYFAPDREVGEGRQEIAVTKSNNFTRWSAPHEITPGFQGGTEYWDYWPEGLLRGNQVVLFYMSERGFDDNETGAGHIWTDPCFGGLDHNGGVRSAP